MKTKKILISILISAIIILNVKIVFSAHYIKNQPKDTIESFSKIETPMDVFNFFFGNEIFNLTSDISEQQKQTNNTIIEIFIVMLILYWLGLLYFFEKEDKCDIQYIDDEEMFKKYNPLIAGCLVDNRNVLTRDVVAVILNMIDSNFIKLTIVPDENSNTVKYKYMISRVKNNEIKMDKIQQYVNNWIFEDMHSEDEQINLSDRLKEISESKDTYNKIQELDIISSQTLEKLGANQPSVPLIFKVYNYILLLISIILTILHVSNNGLNVHVYSYTVIIAIFVFIFIMCIIPILAVGVHLILYLIAFGKRFINIQNEKLTGQKVVSTSIAVITMICIIAIVIVITSHSKVLVIDEIMIGLTLLLIKTDKLMLKNNKEILNDYYNLKNIKEKIEKYSLLNEKDVEFIKLWKEYLSYSVAFGNSNKISGNIRKVYQEDIDIEYLNRWEGVYYISRAYLEIMWDFDFTKYDQAFNKMSECLEDDTKDDEYYNDLKYKF